MRTKRTHRRAPKPSSAGCGSSWISFEGLGFRHASFGSDTMYSQGLGVPYQVVVFVLTLLSQDPLGLRGCALGLQVSQRVLGTLNPINPKP